MTAVVNVIKNNDSKCYTECNYKCTTRCWCLKYLLSEAFEEIINVNLIGWAGSLLTTALSDFLVICTQSTKVKTLRLCLFSVSFTQILQRGLYEVFCFMIY